MITTFTGTRTFHFEDFPIAWNRVAVQPKNSQIVVGGCRGLDAAISRIATYLQYHVTTILPADHSQVDRYWKEYTTDHMQCMGGSDYRYRNTVMVRMGSQLEVIADKEEVPSGKDRSGTWMTKRIWMRTKKIGGHTVEPNIVILHPRGNEHQEVENGPRLFRDERWEVVFEWLMERYPELVTVEASN
jgi:hypothetical protein